MPTRRAAALKRLRGLSTRVLEHLAKLSEPSEVDLLHWRVEIDNWLNQMEAVLDHVGKKTAEEWSARITEWRGRAEKA